MPAARPGPFPAFGLLAASFALGACAPAPSEPFLSADGAALPGLVGLDVRWDQQGVLHASPSIDADESALTLRTAAIGRGDVRGSSAERAVGPSVPEAKDGTFVRELPPGGEEWWRPHALGFEQGWTLDSAPPGEGPLRIDLELRGAAIIEDVEPSIVRLRLGATPLQYACPKAVDAAGRGLPTWFQPSPVGWSVLVADAGAQWPITVDPIFGAPSWVRGGAAAGDRLAVLDGVGDVDGDGDSELLVGAYASDSPELDEGGAELHEGEPSASALQPFSPASTGSWSWESDQPDANFPALRGAGDVDGDGFSDVILAAAAYDAPQFQEGIAWLFRGTAAGLATSPAWTTQGNQLDAYHGAFVAAAGDVNGDGFGDVLVGAHGWANGSVNEGRAALYLGGFGGPDTTPDWTVEGGAADARLGWRVAAAGDVNADGFGDVIVSAPFAMNTASNEGSATVYLGSAAGPDLSPIWQQWGGQVDAHFGYSVAAAGDVNGDGYSDVIVAAENEAAGQAGEGTARLYNGQPGGLSPVPSWLVDGGQVGASLREVAGVGDVNGDGYADVAVGVRLLDNGEADEGQVRLYLGSASGPGTVPAATWEGDQSGAEFGAILRPVGDVSGDGLGDIGIGAYGTDGVGADAGEVSVVFGAAAPFPTTGIVRAGIDSTDLLGSALTAGDVDGDGMDEVIGGAPGRDVPGSDSGAIYVYAGQEGGPPASQTPTLFGSNSGFEFGTALAYVGDVDADGFGDVVVGSPGYTNEEAFEGRVDLYSGTAAGLSATPSWSLEPNTPFHHLGAAVARAGDVDGDGYDDVLIGGDYSARLQRGTATGLTISSYWLQNGPPGTQFFGDSLDGLGDVNGDGFDDVAVGSVGNPDLSGPDEGLAYVYHGSALGLNTDPDSTISVDPGPVSFSPRVARAGDVNGDGYADLLVGAHYLDNGNSDEGAAMLFVGGATGVATDPLWTNEGGQTDARWGASVGSAGDLNRDGFGDIWVGSGLYDSAGFDDGRLRVFFGNAAGVDAAPAYTWAGADIGDEFGASAVVADTDGNGVSDLIVGAPWEDLYNQDAGALHYFLGRSGDGAAPIGGTPRFRIVQPGTATVIAPGGESLAGDGFDVRAFLRSPLGRVGLGIEVETKAVGTPWDGLGTTVSPYNDLPRLGGEVVVAVTGLPEFSAYRVRARVIVDPTDESTAPRGPWVELGRPGDAGAADVHTVEFPDMDNDGDSDSTDCAPTDPTIHTSATELCDGLDQDCDGVVPADEVDGDGDSAFLCDGDCDDSDAARYPGAPEGCDGGDTDCDGNTPGAEIDDDGDGPNDCGGDCEDADATVEPGAPELCDGLDNDCDGALPPDESDGDGDTILVCQGDCDDTLATVFPGATEVCDTTDQDCDPSSGDSVDTDGDGWSACNGDCDDNDVNLSPDATELCNGIDDSCTGSVPPGEVDADGDGVFACANDCDDNDAARAPGLIEACNGYDDDCDPTSDENGDTDGDGASLCEGDCDDADANRSPTFVEFCDGLDNDCDPLTDESVDGDGDAASICDGDCDDAVASIHPGADEGCDGIDTDCDFEPAEDEIDGDGDGVSPCADDCNDDNADIFPGATETCDGADEDCDGLVGPPDEFDVDGDLWSDCAGDCAPFVPAINPGHNEVCDGLDGDCSGALDADELDADGDGFAPCTGDCDDDDAARWPGAPESTTLGVDTNCDGLLGDTDSDGDGRSVGQGDCFDTLDTVYPGADEICDGYDSDCTGGPGPGELADADADGAVDCLDCASSRGTRWPMRESCPSAAAGRSAGWALVPEERRRRARGSWYVTAGVYA